MRRVESLATKNPAYCSSVDSSIDLREDALFVGEGEAAPDRPLDDFGVGDGVAAEPGIKESVILPESEKLDMRSFFPALIH